MKPHLRCSEGVPFLADALMVVWYAQFASDGEAARRLHEQDAPYRHLGGPAMARKFFYVCAGLFMLALSYHFGATTATAQAPASSVAAAARSPRCTRHGAV